eukprot:TRINITY_DN13950_c0_g1_i2.p1 TRINITY_DN13950_c0_g1~~TRINITY_DN13950_c0_g1_i2.p1  ORF type:complete len:362 (+),score=79.45 TRINITY_DN13950_c0_g1_i2:99-1184(+)
MSDECSSGESSLDEGSLNKSTSLDEPLLHQAEEKIAKQEKVREAIQRCMNKLKRANYCIKQLSNERKNKTGEEFLKASQMLDEAYQSKESIELECSEQVDTLQEQLQDLQLTAEEEKVHSSSEKVYKMRVAKYSEMRRKVAQQLSKPCELRERQRFERALAHIDADIKALHAKQTAPIKTQLTIEVSDAKSQYRALQIAKLKSSVEVQINLSLDNYRQYLPLCRKTDLETRVLEDMNSRRTVPKKHKIRPIGAAAPAAWRPKCLNHRIQLLRKVQSGEATTDDIIWDRGRRREVDDDIDDSLRILSPQIQQAASVLEKLAAEMKSAGVCFLLHFQKKETNSSPPFKTPLFTYVLVVVSIPK